MTLDVVASDIFAAEECEQFARSVDGFLAAHAAPEAIDRWRVMAKAGKTSALRWLFYGLAH